MADSEIFNPDLRPYDPECNRYPDEITEYVRASEEEDITPDEYVAQEEGTYNSVNGHFLCTECYIKVGMPTAPNGWTCP
jgi:hypothetical protein